MKNRYVYFILIILVLAILGCEESKKQSLEVKETKESQYGDIYRRAISYDYMVLDPAHLKEAVSNEVCRQSLLK